MKKSRKTKVLFVIIAVVLVASLAIGGYALYGKYQMSRIPGLSFNDALDYTLKNNSEAVITVGTIRSGQASYTVYGENGTELPAEEHIYEIGSLTKTFTAALVEKGVEEGKINLSDTVDMYLSLPKENNYPTIRQLLTHTSGYKAYYFESPMFGNFVKGRNEFCGIGEDMMLNRLAKLSDSGNNSAFNYSNFGYATLGLILEAVYNEEYTALVNCFVKDELGLQTTQISDGSGDLGKYWDWQEKDTYLAAGGLTSNITDMLAYAQMQLSEEGSFAVCHEPLAAINASTNSYMKMGIFMDEIGMSWIIDNENGIVWHNGGTGDYNCYLGFDLKTGTAVVILSNLAPNYRIPATVLGVKLMKELNK
ncbi:MAG: class A beta-lactamase-related serine hydrolase [Clostridia bacterium]|nr:class A beta-lactamase-related serine hydrolase [Clostridia bacterium]